jgi:hypothetical protein
MSRRSDGRAVKGIGGNLERSAGMAIETIGPARADATLADRARRSPVTAGELSAT